MKPYTVRHCDSSKQDLKPETAFVGKGGERERETDRDRDRETETERQTETDRQTDRGTHNTLVPQFFDCFFIAFHRFATSLVLINLKTARFLSCVNQPEDSPFCCPVQMCHELKTAYFLCSTGVCHQREDSPVPEQC